MDQNSKQSKIDKILALLSGEISPDDVNPECCMMIGYGEENTYLVNGKKVTQEVYSKASANLQPTTFNITYGEYEK